MINWIWFMLLAGGIVAAGLMVGYYYLMGSPNSAIGGPDTPDLAATAVFKLTATRAAIEGEGEAGAEAETFQFSADMTTPEATFLPTNTPRGAAPAAPSFNAQNQRGLIP